MPKDESQAFLWYEKAANQGCEHGQYNLGHCYFHGFGTVKDYVKAFLWYRKAAEQGDEFAQYSLGDLYANGEGTPKDEVEAYAFFNLAGVHSYNERTRKRLITLEQKLSREEIAAGQRRSKELQKEIEARILAKKAGK